MGGIGVANRAQAGGRDARGRDVPPDAVEEPSWAIPVVVILVVGILSLGFLAYYFAPTVSEILGHAPKPSQESQPVDVTIAGVRYLIPANYTRFAYGRRGGMQDKIELYALLPDLKPYEPDNANSFQDYSADSRVAYFDIEIRRDRMTEEERFRKLYLRLVTDNQGSRGPYGLRRYSFDPTTGYRDEELLVKEHDDGTVVVFRCYRELPTVASPTCRRDLELGDGLALHYRFMRSQLGQWEEIDQGVRALVQSFVVAPKPQ
jgi:hypothetical protein